MPVDDLIFGEPVPPTRTPEDWNAIVSRLVATLAEAIELPLVVDRFNVIDGVALSCHVETAKSLAGPLAIGVTATIGFELIQQRPHVNALVFLFADGKRLSLRGVEEGFAEFIYESNGRWRLNGWADDEYGEFTNWPAPHSSTDESPGESH